VLVLLVAVDCFARGLPWSRSVLVGDRRSGIIVRSRPPAFKSSPAPHHVYRIDRPNKLRRRITATGDRSVPRSRHVELGIGVTPFGHRSPNGSTPKDRSTRPWWTRRHGRYLLIGISRSVYRRAVIVEQLRRRNVLRGLVLVLLGLCWGLCAASASAAVRSGSETFNPNETGATFGNPPSLPDIVISVSYDDAAGTVTVSETGGDPSYTTGFAWFGGIELTGTDSPEISIQGYWDYPSTTPTLTDSAVNGSLTPEQVTKSSDGSTITAIWSDPALANQPLTFVNIEQSDQPDNSCDCDVEPAGSFYFTGYEPTVVVLSPGIQTTEVNTPLGTGECGINGAICCPTPGQPSLTTPCNGVQINATEVNVANGAYGDDPSSTNGTEAPYAYAATGLPPGLSIDPQSGLITGSPTTAGTYTPTVSATAKYNDNQSTAAGSTSFTWTITPAPPKPAPKPKPVRIPKVAVFDGAPDHGKGLQEKPYQLVYTGDGTGQLAGPGRHGSHSPRAWGRLRWSKWGTTSAAGTGDDWIDNCNPDCARGKFTPYHVDITLRRPEYEHGYEVFTRLTIRYTGRRPPFAKRAETWSLSYSDGGFGWG
jgi:hypothetical protein